MSAIEQLFRNSSPEALDATDAGLLSRLMVHGRATWADLAVELDLTAPAIAQRVRRLEDRGIIRQFAAIVDPRVVAPVAAFVSVGAKPSDGLERMRQQLTALESVQECHFVGGAGDHLLKVRCASMRELEHLIAVTLPKAGAVVTSVRVVLSTAKETPVLPLAGSCP